MTKNKQKKPFFQRVLDKVEIVGNKLPHPVTLFAILMGVVLLLSWIFGGLFETSVLKPGTGGDTGNPEEWIVAKNLLSKDGIQQIFTRMVTEFAAFPPLGIVLVVMLGIGVAEYTGMISVGLRSFVNKAPRATITFFIVVAGMLSTVAADAGYVVLIPMGGAIFYGMGRHPLGGIAAAFAGVSGGFGANIIPTGLDPMIASFTEPAAQLVAEGYTVNPLSNWYLMAASVPIIGLLGTWVTEKIVMPRLGEYKPDGDLKIEEEKAITAQEKKALRYAGFSILILLGLIALVIIPPNGLLRGTDGFGVIPGQAGSNIYTWVTYADDNQGNGLAFVPEEKDYIGLAYNKTIPSASSDPVDYVWSKLSGEQGYQEPQDPEDPDGQTLFTWIAYADNEKGDDFSFNPTDKKYVGSAFNKELPSVSSNPSDYNWTQIQRSGSMNPFYQSLVPIMFIVFLVAGLVYGIVAKTIKNDKDVAAMASKSMATMGLYIVIAFVAAQFVAYFNWSNLGSILAVKGSEGLKAIGFEGPMLLVAFIIVASIVNLVMGSASAKWALLAPIFVPMLMYMGYSPETTQAAYRIGDSYSNILTPLLPYFPLVIVFCQKYVKNVGIGTLISMMLPFAIAFAVVRIPMFILWIFGGLPLGVEGPIYYVPEVEAALVDSLAIM